MINNKYTYIYIYIYTYVYTYIPSGGPRAADSHELAAPWVPPNPFKPVSAEP